MAVKIDSIRELSALRGFPEPKHPLISVINIADMQTPARDVDVLLSAGFYFIGISRFTQTCVQLQYGQQAYDFDKGMMSFIAPGRVFGFNPILQQVAGQSGWLLLVHPDYLWKHTLAQQIKQFDFFDYSLNEALFLSESEERIIDGLFKTIEQAYNSAIDAFSQSIIIPLIESLLGYAARFYQRQFITREISHHGIVHQLEVILEAAFSKEVLEEKGVPTVKDISGQLNISANYLSGLLKAHTGSTTQQHIQAKIIEKAKEKLVMTDLSVNEIAFELGFEYPQSFTKLFKMKTNVTPLRFRKGRGSIYFQ